LGVIAGTAGHIDHGKSTLVQLLTGKDPDRLREEKKRGITIELGYVFMPTPDGGVLSFIDVPGHERFVRQMVAGVATVDFFLLVVAADEGVMPQTVEHFEILDLLGVSRGAVALTKCDLVDDELAGVAEEEVTDLLAGTEAEGAPVIRVSAIDGRGIEELKALLAEMAADSKRRSSEGDFRLAIDRVFVLQGYGTIVGGTALSGTVRVGDELELQPGGETYRVREMRVNEGRSTDAGRAGDRIALNLVGLEKEMVARGHCLGTPGTLEVVDSLDAHCEMLPDAAVDLEPRTRVRFHTGTAEVMARAVPVAAEGVPRGGSGYVHFQLEEPVVAMPGDRYVIRRYSPVVTIGGGRVLETETRKVRSRFREARRERMELLQAGDLEGLIQHLLGRDKAGAIGVSKVCSRFGLEAEDVLCAARELQAGGRVRIVGEGASAELVGGGLWSRARSDVLEALARHHESRPASPGLPASRLASAAGGHPAWLLRELLRELQDSGEVRRTADALALASHPEELPEELSRRAAAVEAEVAEAGFRPPALSELDDGRLAEDLAARGRLLELGDGHVTTPDIARRCSGVLRERFADSGFRLGEMRDALGVTRKYALMWAGLLDGMELTVRRGDYRYLRRG
jgi:selenocysteine-specific elongation factor